MSELETRLRASGGALLRASHPDLKGHLDRKLRDGTLLAILPGVYCRPTDRDNFYVRLRAAVLWAGPDAVVTGRAAARITFWPSCSVDTISLALQDQGKRVGGGRASVPFAVECRRIPEWLVRHRGRVRVTLPSLTAVDLAGGSDRGNAIDQALRTGSTTLDELWEAFRAQPARPGNVQRRQVLVDSRDEPWSEAERLQHALLHDAKIGGWSANCRVSAGGHDYFADVLFRRERLILEVDGWETHGSRAAFEADRERRNHLVLAGYRVLSFTWRQLVERPEWVLSCIRAALGR